MHRRDILKAFLFSSSTVSAAVSNTQPVPELIAEPRNHARFFSSKWSQVPDMVWNSDGLPAQSSDNWCIRNGELLCLVQAPHRLINLKTHSLSADSKPFSAEMVLRFMDKAAAIASIGNLAGFSFGSANKFDEPNKEIKAGITRAGHLFIGKSISNKDISESILKENVRLVLSVFPESAVGCFAKLKALDQAGNTLATLSSIEYRSQEWEGSIGILSHFTSIEVNAERPSVAISKFEISGEKLRHYSELEG